jgi:hypothetical protein
LAPGGAENDREAASENSVRLAGSPTDIEENTYVAHVMAGNISKAMAAGQIEPAERNGQEPIDWAVVFMCEGHVKNINDEPDVV